MAQWTLSHAAEIQDGPTYKVKSKHLKDNFTGLKSDIDDRLSKVASSSQSVVSPLVFQGALTLDVAPLVDEINEKTSGHGVVIDGLTIKDNAINSGYIPLVGSVFGCLPSYVDAASISIATGWFTDSTGLYYLKVTTPLTVSLASSGAGGLDTGSEASNTWYYLYLIGKTDGTVSAVFSVTNEAASGSITLPSGYTLKRQLPFAVRNDASSNILPFYVSAGWPFRPTIMYQVPNTRYTSSLQAGTTQILSAGTAAAFTSVSASAFVPPIAGVAALHVMNNSATNQALHTIRPNSSFIGYGVSMLTLEQLWVPHFQLSSSQSLEYRREGGSGSLSIDIMGFTVTEVA